MDRKYSEEEAKVKLDVIRGQYQAWFGQPLDNLLLTNLLHLNLDRAKELFIKEVIGQNDVQQTFDLLETLNGKVHSDEQADTAGQTSEKGGRRSKRADKGTDHSGDVHPES